MNDTERDARRTNTILHYRKEHHRQLAAWRRMVREALDRTEMLKLPRRALLRLSQDVIDFRSIAYNWNPKLARISGVNSYLDHKDMFIRNPHLAEPENESLPNWSYDSQVYRDHNEHYSISVEDLDLFLTVRDFLHELVGKFCPVEARIFTGYGHTDDLLKVALTSRYQTEAFLEQYNRSGGQYHPRWTWEEIDANRKSGAFMRQVAKDIVQYGEGVLSEKLEEYADHLDGVEHW